MFSVERSSKCNKFVGGWGFALDPTGRADSAPQTPIWVWGEGKRGMPK